MSVRFVHILFLFFFAKYAISQDVELVIKEKMYNSNVFSSWDSMPMADYSDSLKQALNSNLLTGITFSIFNEPANDVSLLCEMNETEKAIIFPDNRGRFFICTDSIFSETIRLTILGENYRKFDTLLYWKNYKKTPLALKLVPRYKISIRGKVYNGSLPIEQANVEIIHKSDTFRTQTKSCYFDNENYWNCLYLGMFKHTLAFDKPEDTVYIAVSKEGYRTSTQSFRCDNYDGTILPVKLKYSKILPKLYTNNICFKITPPVFDNWMVAMSYDRVIKIGGIKRFGIGLEGSMLISTISTSHTTFRNINDIPDTTYYTSNFDSSYNKTLLSPQVYFLLNNPQRRNLSVYSGICFPYSFNDQKFQIQAFVGTRFFLDLNKALMLECRYISYSYDIAHYTFNAYGNANRYIKYESFKKIIINLGLQISF